MKQFLFFKQPLVTGGAGFIGSHMVKRLLADGLSVVVIDDLSMGKVKNLPDDPRLTFVEGSITDDQLMTKLMATQYDYIFHFAAVASVADSVARPVATHQVNGEASLLLLNLAKQTQKHLQRLVFSSSAAVYGDLPELPKKEDGRVAPQTPYAVDKYAAERYFLNYYHLYGVKTSCVRLFNVFGADQNPSSPYSGVISIIANVIQKQRAGKPTAFTVLGDGNQTRDYTYVEDVINALIYIAHSDAALGEVYNIGNTKSTSLNELISMFEQISHTDITIKHAAKRDGDIVDSTADNTKLKALGYTPNFSVKTGLQEYWRYLQNNID